MVGDVSRASVELLAYTLIVVAFDFLAMLVFTCCCCWPLHVLDWNTQRPIRMKVKNCLQLAMFILDELR